MVGLALPLLLALGTAVALAPTARADDPFRLQQEVTDKVGAFDGRVGEVQQAIDRLRTDQSAQLFVVFVDSFEGTDPQDWADETAAESDLGRNDLLLAVAVRDRSYAYSVDAGFELDDARLY